MKSLKLMLVMERCKYLWLYRRRKDYSNNVSNLGVKLGEVTEDFLTKGLGGIFKVVSKLVTN